MPAKATTFPDPQPKKRDHLSVVKTPKQRQKLYDEIERAVALLVEDDETGHALSFLIDVATGVYQSEWSLGANRASDLPEYERRICATKMIEQAFTLSTSHGEAMIAWLALDETEPKKQVKAARG